MEDVWAVWIAQIELEHTDCLTLLEHQHCVFFQLHHELLLEVEACLVWQCELPECSPLGDMIDAEKSSGPFFEIWVVKEVVHRASNFDSHLQSLHASMVHKPAHSLQRQDFVPVQVSEHKVHGSV